MLDEMSVDEVYTFYINKKTKAYIWTCIGKLNGESYRYFHLTKRKTKQDELAFQARIPDANVVYSDKNFAYEAVFGEKNIAQKGAKTNLVESLNSQLRQYCSKIRRKTKSYAKNFIQLRNHLAFLFLSF
jgi:IS1 family transposase